MGTLVDQSIRTKNTWVHVLIRKNIDYEHMGIRVDQNIQTKEHMGTRVDQNI